MRNTEIDYRGENALILNQILATILKRNAWRSVWRICMWILGLKEGGVRGVRIPHMVAREYRNTASKFSQIPKPQLQMGKT